MNTVQRILIIKWGALGDLIAGTVAIRAVREQYPQASITLLSNKLMAEVCPPGSLVDEIIFYDPMMKSVIGQFKLVKELRGRNFDAAINLRWTSERSAAIGWLSGARVRVGSGPKESRWMYNVKVPLYNGRRHEFLRHLDIAQSMGITAYEPKPFVFLSADHQKFTRIFMEEHGCSKFSTLVMHPGASISSKAWLSDRYGEIGKRFVERCNGRVIVTWGPDEESLANEVVERVGTNAFKSPPTTIGKLASLIQHCGLLLCNYSGVMNVGMAVETPLIALGCTSPEDWGPYGSLHRTVNTAHENDSYSEHERFELMKKISVDEVWNLLDQRWTELYFHAENGAMKR